MPCEIKRILYRSDERLCKESLRQRDHSFNHFTGVELPTRIR